MTEFGFDEMDSNEIWEQIEGCFCSVHQDVANRCYQERSATGVRYIQHLVRRSLAFIDRALLEIEVRSEALDAKGKP